MDPLFPSPFEKKVFFSYGEVISSLRNSLPSFAFFSACTSRTFIVPLELKGETVFPPGQPGLYLVPEMSRGGFSSTTTQERIPLFTPFSQKLPPSILTPFVRNALQGIALSHRFFLKIFTPKERSPPLCFPGGLRHLIISPARSRTPSFFSLFSTTGSASNNESSFPPR